MHLANNFMRRTKFTSGSDPSQRVKVLHSRTIWWIIIPTTYNKRSYRDDTLGMQPQAMPLPIYFLIKNDIQNDLCTCTLMYLGSMTDSTRYGTPDNNNNLPMCLRNSRFGNSAKVQEHQPLTDQITQDSLSYLPPSKVPPITFTHQLILQCTAPSDI